MSLRILPNLRLRHVAILTNPYTKPLSTNDIISRLLFVKNKQDLKLKDLVNNDIEILWNRPAHLDEGLLCAASRGGLDAIMAYCIVNYGTFERVSLSGETLNLRRPLRFSVDLNTYWQGERSQLFLARYYRPEESSLDVGRYTCCEGLSGLIRECYMARRKWDFSSYGPRPARLSRTARQTYTKLVDYSVLVSHLLTI